MKKQYLVALAISIVVIALTSFIILTLEPSKEKIPYYHDKTASEVKEFLLNLKESDTSSELLFKDMIDVDDDTLKYVLGIEPTYLEDYSVMLSETNSSTILILKLKPGSKSIIEQSVVEYMAYSEKQWEDIDEAEAGLIQNYKKIVIEDYLIYVVSKNNEYINTALNPFFYYVDEK